MALLRRRECGKLVSDSLEVSGHCPQVRWPPRKLTTRIELWKVVRHRPVMSLGDNPRGILFDFEIKTKFLIFDEKFQAIWMKQVAWLNRITWNARLEETIRLDNRRTYTWWYAERGSSVILVWLEISFIYTNCSCVALVMSPRSSGERRAGASPRWTRHWLYVRHETWPLLRHPRHLRNRSGHIHNLPQNGNLWFVVMSFYGVSVAIHSAPSHTARFIITVVMHTHVRLAGCVAQYQRSVHCARRNRKH